MINYTYLPEDDPRELDGEPIKYYPPPDSDLYDHDTYCQCRNCEGR